MSDQGTRFTDARQAALEKKIERIYKEAQKEILEKLKKHERKKTAMMRVKEAQVKAGTLSQAEYDRWLAGQEFIGKQWKDKAASIAETLKKANEQANALVEGEKRVVFGENATFQAYQLEHDAGVDLSFTPYDSATVSRLIKDEPELLPRKVVNGKKDIAWNKRGISNAVTQGIIQGESVDEIAKRIAKQTSSSNMKAMKRYARTAMTGAQNAGRMEMLHNAQDMGIKVKKRWLATLDGRTRDAHQELDGQIRYVDEPFDSALGKIMYPGDMHAAAGNIWNCRCTLVYVYDDYPNVIAFRRDNIDGMRVRDMTYKEWKERKEWRTSETNKEQNASQTTKKVVKSEKPVQEEKKEFTPAQTIEEAEAFARTFCDDRKFGAVGVSYDGLTLSSANAVNKTISDFYYEYKIDKFGGVVAPAGNTKLGKLVSEAVAGYSPVRHSIILNRKSLKSVDAAAKDFQRQQEMVTSYLKNPSGWKIKSEVAKKVLEASAVSGRATVPMTVEEAIWHELGHSLEKELRNLPNYSSIKAKHAEWGAKISGYATTNFDEYIAESFCAMKKGETIESELADAFKSLRR